MNKKLNLGAGFHPKDGYLNTDSDPRTNCESIFDLEVFPWPLPSDQFNKVELSHVLEHLNQTEDVLREIHRICAPDGIVEWYLMQVVVLPTGTTKEDLMCPFHFTFAKTCLVDSRI